MLEKYACDSLIDRKYLDHKIDLVETINIVDSFDSALCIRSFGQRDWMNTIPSVDLFALSFSHFSLSNIFLQ